MKWNIEEIIAKLKPETTIEEVISYCDTIDDFNNLFEEFCRMQKQRSKLMNQKLPSN